MASRRVYREFDNTARNQNLTTQSLKDLHEEAMALAPFLNIMEQKEKKKK
jgi:hypothetical protein